MSRSGIQMTFASSLLVIGLLSSSVADASGGYSGRPGGTSSNDPTYHRGKSLFHGRDREFRPGGRLRVGSIRPVAEGLSAPPLGVERMRCGLGRERNEKTQL